MDNFNDIDLLQVIRAFQQETFAKLNVMRIGIIEEVLVDNEVRCSITNKKLIKTNPDGTSTWRDYPPIFAKVWYMGSGLNGIDFPLTVNTPCLLLFNDREFTSYFDSGKISPLANTLMHDLSYCVCVPLYQQTSSKDFNISTDGVIKIKSPMSIELDAPDVTTTGNLKSGTGFTGLVPCGSSVLSFDGGILTGVTP
jgi:hypothetical protein